MLGDSHTHTHTHTHTPRAHTRAHAQTLAMLRLLALSVSISPYSFCVFVCCVCVLCVHARYGTLSTFIFPSVFHFFVLYFLEEMCIHVSVTDRRVVPLNVSFMCSLNACASHVLKYPHASIISFLFQPRVPVVQALCHAWKYKRQPEFCS
jgi:hypothetical protein